MISLFFCDKILSWYASEKRDLPWRNTCNPYKIWISEVIMQQTRIDQGLSYYNRFIEKFPSLELLANADEEDILKIWQGLGYYSRARNLHSGAKQILNDLKGEFPNTAAELKTIKGIGVYTSAAISSIVFNEVIAAVDGNVYRVLSRVFGIKEPIDTASGQKIFQSLANELISRKNPGNYNQAIMEFGAIQCKPRNPNCSGCIFSSFCLAYNSNQINELPLKSKKVKVIERYFNYLVIHHGDSIYFKKRTQNDIWKNLYDFPLIETNKPISLIELIETEQWGSIFTNRKIAFSNFISEKIHILTHQKIHVRFFSISMSSKKNLPSHYIKRNKRNIFELAVPKLIENYIFEIETSL